MRIKKGLKGGKKMEKRDGITHEKQNEGKTRRGNKRKKYRVKRAVGVTPKERRKEREDRQ